MAAITQVRVRVDFSRSDPERLERAMSLVRGLPPARSAATVAQAEVLACLAFVAAANEHACALLKEKVRQELRMAGLPRAADRLLSYFYETTIGQFLDIQDIRQGSCESSCSRKKPDQVRTFIYAVAAFLGGGGFSASDVGNATFEAIGAPMDYAAEVMGEVLHSAASDFSQFRIEQKLDGFLCTVTICLDPPHD